MSLFQKSVEKKYLNELDSVLIDKKYKEFQSYFGNPSIQENIRNSKEEQFQEGFLRELFVSIFGYTLNPQPNFNLTTELKNIANSKKADGAILKGEDAFAVIELKGTDTTDLDRIETQAFGYKNHHPKCVYVITSNFEKLRFYIQNAVDHIDFDLFNLTREQFSLMWLCLAKDNLLNGLPQKIKESSLLREENITKKLYADYSKFREAIYNNLVKNNPETDKLLLFKKTQKLLDRFLFIFFAEDRLLLPPNSISEIVKQWTTLKEELDEYVPLYDRFKKYFGYMNTGYKGKKYDIYAYNGGLFAPDEILDNISIDDEILHKHTSTISNYDFETDVDVNILGHIFEHSLGEIENVQAEIKGEKIDSQKTRRKKDGIFYTPKYITKYIVENTIGKLCEEKRTELDIVDEEYSKGRKNRKKDTIKTLEDKLIEYRNWLLSLTILDPACGSGAFLNQALDFLIAEHRKIDDLRAQLFGSGLVFSDITTDILEKNIYGVDLNEESVEIAKLSLWLRTAQKGRKLNKLNNNIKCGNSLIDDPEVAGEKAFNWQNEFPEIFAKGGFDVVIGNPPYGAYLDENSKLFLNNTYSTFQGNFEIYFFFIELINKLLKAKGLIGYITPDTWISVPQAQRLREFILEKFSIITIISYKYSVFEDASLNPIVFILGKSLYQKECEVFHVTTKTEDIYFQELDLIKCNVKKWISSNDKQFQIWQNAIDINIIEKIEKNSLSGIDFLDVCQGIVPYSTENLSKEEVKSRIYHSSSKIDENYGMWAQGRAIKRYGVVLSTFEYLKYGEWLHRPRKPKYFNGKRILIQEITGGNPPRISSSIFNDTLYHDPGIISCLNTSELSTEFILAVINSKLISWYNLKTSPKGKRLTFPKVLIGDIRNFPIKKPDAKQEDEFNKQVKKISEFTQSLVQFQSTVLAFISNKFALEKTSNNLINWDTLEFNDFVSELKKAKIKIGLSEEAEWLQYFKEQKEKAQNLKTEINKTDNEIDRMVYELYGLTEEEIKIVEGNS
ncbi:MAG: N-6 DNA methylase [Bacteroidales bacterium]|nr:N-6 DNA methylase [Bacteroidales bacterium]